MQNTTKNSNFIYCFDEILKSQLLSKGYKLISSNDKFSVFVNNTNLNFELNDINKEKYCFSNRMMF